MSQFPTLEIVSDDRAIIVRGDFRYDLADGYAQDIIAMYRHQLTHGEVLAQTYLAGVIAGMRHANSLEIERVLARVRARRSEEGS